MACSDDEPEVRRVSFVSRSIARHGGDYVTYFLQQNMFVVELDGVEPIERNC